jgi:alginate O-acetyltransferase complex protein AlgI
MVFSSQVFLFLFLPVVLACYYGIFRKNRRWQNILLTFASLGFYAWGEPFFILVMLGSIAVNWFLGLRAGRYAGNRRARRTITVVTVAVNIGVLFVFKYLSFFANAAAGSRVLNIALPIGISFFTFQAMSYVFDIQRGRGQARKNPLDVALYISFFPQLIAGPIVRYETIAEQINNRRETLSDFTDGVERFIIGLSKKVLLANSLAIVADNAFDSAERTLVMAWAGALAYTFQIYHDFSGYSDMAIGLGKMFGFKFNENFNYPYMAKSIGEFWQRWHISLGLWFRDYVYFPLGGSRVKTKTRLVFNLFAVWFLTGVWHGANWTFFLWGLMYFALIISEKLTGFAPKLGKFGHVYAMLFVLFGWVIFRADSLSAAFGFMSALFGAGETGFVTAADMFLLKNNVFFLIAGAVFTLPVAKKLPRAIQTAGLAVCFLLAISYMVKGSYNPFIYFNF